MRKMKKSFFKYISLMLVLALVLGLTVSFGCLKPQSVSAEQDSVTTYDIWLGSTQVTSANANDILGDGKAIYDADNYELILDEPMIEGMHSDGTRTYKIYIGQIAACPTISGSYHMTSAEADCGIGSDGGFWLKGDFSFIGTSYGLYSNSWIRCRKGNLYLEGGIYGAYLDNIYDHSGTYKSIAFSDTMESAEFVGQTAAIGVDIVSLADSVAVTEPENSQIIINEVDKTRKIYNEDGVTEPTHVIVNQLSQLWVGDTLVTDANKDDVLGDGKVTYNPENKTLTLDEPVIPDSHEFMGHHSKITAIHHDVIIEGNYHMTSSDATDVGLYSFGSHIGLDGDFAFYGTEDAISYASYLNYLGGVPYLLLIEGGSLYAEGGTFGIYTDYLLIGGANTYVETKGYTSDDEYSCIASKDIILGVEMEHTVDEYDHDVFEPKQFDVSFDVSELATAPASQTVKYGQLAEKPIDPEAEGYKFDGWYSDDTYTTEFDFTVGITDNTTVYGKWNKLYTVDFAGEGTEIEGLVVEDGKVVEKPEAPEKDGYVFDGFYKDADFTEEFDFDEPITDNTTIYVKWLKACTITLDLDGGSMDGQTGFITIDATEGDEITLGLPKKDGCTFDYWEGSRYNAGDIYTVSEDHTLKAVWKVNTVVDNNTVSNNTETPKTGDNNNMMMYVILAMLSLAGGVAVRRKNVSR